MKKTVKLTVSFKNDFIPFLEDNQACKDYVVSVIKRHRDENSKNRDEAALQDYIYKRLQDTIPSMWVSGLFVWIDTDKGQDFWSDISDLWEKFLQDEAGTAGMGDFEEVGEISKSDVKELFVLKSLRGKYYKVTDLSYNRPVTDEWDCREWKSCKSSVELHETGGTYLVLSDYPEDKVMLWHGDWSSPRPMIKVWIPELDRAQWVFYNRNGLRETE